MKDYISLIIWVVAIGTAFAFLWYKGYWARLANYVQDTKEELRKCTWPTVDELKGSTVVIMISIIILGGYTVGVDFVITLFVRMIT